MKTVFICIYMFLRHPILFFIYTVRKDSKYFLVNGNAKDLQIKGLIVGKKVRFGHDTRISFYGNKKMVVGNNCYFVDHNSFIVGGSIKIGNNVLIASDVCIISENHQTNPFSDKEYMNQEVLMKEVQIDDGCWIAEKVIILPGVHIGEKAVIGAGSVVTKNVPPFSIAVGNPAKVIKIFNFKSKQWEQYYG